MYARITGKPGHIRPYKMCIYNHVYTIILGWIQMLFVNVYHYEYCTGTKKEMEDLMKQHLDGSESTPSKTHPADLLPASTEWSTVSPPPDVTTPPARKKSNYVYMSQELYNPFYYQYNLFQKKRTLLQARRKRKRGNLHKSPKK